MRRRVLAAVSVSAVLVSGLVGCSAGATAPDECVAPLQPGMLTNGIELTGLEDGVPEVTITGGADIMNAQRSVLQRGESNRAITDGDVVTANVTILSGASGETLVPTQKRFLQALPDEIMPDFLEFLTGGDADRLQYSDVLMAGIICAAPGDVIAVATTPGQSSTSGLGTDAAVMVVELLGAQGASASGANRSLPFGFPAVASGLNGRPGVVLPPQDAPGEIRVAANIAGDGPVVTAEDYLIGNVLTVGWDGTDRRNTWESSIIELGSESIPADFSLREALTGQTVGSRVVILDPNDGDPQVHVVDIIAAG